MTPPLLQGGQGRTPHDIESDATFLAIAAIVAVIVLAVSFVLAWGAS